MSAIQLLGVTALDGGTPVPAAGSAELVPFKDIAAVVREAEYAVPEPDRSAAAAQRAVVETIFAQRAVLPAPVGVVFRSRDTLMKWMELHYVALSDGLAFVEGRAVARVHIEYDPRSIATTSEIMDPPADPSVAAAEIYRSLRRHAVAAIPLRADEEPSVLVGAFLVEQDRWDHFVDALRDAERRADGLHFRATGPWPPYDFVQMQFGG